MASMLARSYPCVPNTSAAASRMARRLSSRPRGRPRRRPRPPPGDGWRRAWARSTAYHDRLTLLNGVVNFVCHEHQLRLSPRTLTAPADTGDGAERLDRRTLAVVGVMAAAAFMAVLDGTVVTVAIDTFTDTFGSSVSTIGWVSVGYLLAAAVSLPVSGWAIERFGGRRVFLTGLAVFVVGSALSSLAWSAASLIVFRVLQGFGGGALEPTALTLAARTADGRRVGAVMGFLSLVVNVAPVLGPMLGGLLVEGGHWRWIFLVNVPIGLLVMMVALLVVPNDPGDAAAERSDLKGLGLLVTGVRLRAAVDRTDRGPGTPGGRSSSRRPSAPGCSAGTSARSRRVARPVIDLRLFAERGVRQQRRGHGARRVPDVLPTGGPAVVRPRRARPHRGRPGPTRHRPRARVAGVDGPGRAAQRRRGTAPARRPGRAGDARRAWRCSRRSRARPRWSPCSPCSLWSAWGSARSAAPTFSSVYRTVPAGVGGAGDHDDVHRASRRAASLGVTVIGLMMARLGEDAVRTAVRRPHPRRAVRSPRSAAACPARRHDDRGERGGHSVLAAGAPPSDRSAGGAPPGWRGLPARRPGHGCCVAFTSREMHASAADAFAVLIDPETYPRWLIGAKEIRDVDDNWPEPGSRFHHVVGVGPLQIPDHTEVLAIEPGRLLTLKVKARPFVSAEARFTIVGDAEGDRCVVSLQEEPTVRWAGNLVRPVMDPSIHVRNHRSLLRLAAVVEHRSWLTARHGRTADVTVNQRRRDRHRRRTQRAGGGERPRRQGMAGARPRGQRRARRRRAHRRDHRARLPQRPVQRVLPAGRRLAGHQLVGPRGARPDLDARPRRARPPARRPPGGGAEPRPGNHHGQPRARRTGRRRGVAADLRALDARRPPVPRRAAVAVPARPRRSAPGPRRRPERSARPRPARRDPAPALRRGGVRR